MKRLRVYVDTSIVGGCLDPEFATESRALLEMARAGTIILLVSDVLVDELRRAPEAVAEVLASLPRHAVELVAISPESESLRDAYLSAGVLSDASANDAHHVALATDLIHSPKEVV